MRRPVAVLLVVLVAAFLLGFMIFTLLPVRDGSQEVPLSELLGDDEKLTWTWDTSTNQNHPLSNLELQRTLNFLKARFGFTYDWVAETGELYPGGSGTELNGNYWEAIRMSKQLASVASYREFAGADWTRQHAGDRLFSALYFDFLTQVVAAEWQETQAETADIPILSASGAAAATVLAVEPATPRTTVYVNGRELGKAPIEILGMPDGARVRVGVYRNGYASLEKWVIVRDGQVVVISPRLSRLSARGRLEAYARYLWGLVG